MSYKHRVYLGYGFATAMPMYALVHRLWLHVDWLQAAILLVNLSAFLCYILNVTDQLMYLCGL